MVSALQPRAIRDETKSKAKKEVKRRGLLAKSHDCQRREMRGREEKKDASRGFLSGMSVGCTVLRALDICVG